MTDIDYKKKYKELAYKVCEACWAFESLEYWLDKYREKGTPLPKDEELNCVSHLRKRLGRIIGATDYYARFDWSIEPEKKGDVQ